MFARAALAFLVLPGTVAFLVPLLLLRAPGQRWVNPVGLVPLAIGVILFLWCVRDFYVAGKGTLAPWDPPRKLVVVGLYRWSRNPMYIAVSLVLLGWAIGFASRAMFIYAIAIMIVFHLRVVFFEEPWLARTHGEEFERYRARVPRWFGRLER